MRLSDASIARLEPRDREYTVWDSRVAGLGVRVRPSGHRGYVYLHRVCGRTKRLGLGPVAFKCLDEVRRQCHTLAAQPPAPNAKAAEAPPTTLAAFVADEWKAARYARYKPTWRKTVDWLLKAQVLPAFGSFALTRMDRNTVLRWFDAYSATAPGAANHALALLCQILNHAIKCGHLTTNPTRGIQRNRPTTLTRFLSKEEIRKLHRVLDGYATGPAAHRQQADIIRLLLLTGCRKSEILNLRWQELDGSVLHLIDGKTGARTVYLNDQARGIIERQPRGQSALVFPSPRDPSRPVSPSLSLWYTIRSHAGIRDVRLHDLRHTFASHAVLQGVALPVVSRLLGHARVHMTLRYAHVADREVELAAERIGLAIDGLLTRP